MSEKLKEDLEEECKQPDINVSMLGVYDVQFVLHPNQKCLECHMFLDPSWCRWYSWRIENPSHEPKCQVTSIIVKEKQSGK